MQYRIKIVGTAEIDSPLDINQDYSIALKRLGIKSVTHTINTDDPQGCYTYSLESLDEVTIIGAGATVIKGKVKSQSKKLRSRIYFLAQERGLDPEQLYQSIMQHLILNIEVLNIEEIYDRKDN